MPNNVQGYDEEFTRDRELIFDQAVRIEKERVGHTAQMDDVYYLFFGRCVLVPAPAGYHHLGNGMRNGWEVVAYRCDEYGRVYAWDRRYERQACDFGHAVETLRYEIVNELATLHNYEDVY